MLIVSVKYRIKTCIIAGPLERMKNVEWKGKLGKGLRVTARIANVLSDVPGAGIIKSAASLGANLLDPPVTLKEIKELQEELQSLQIDNSKKMDRAKSLLSQQIEDLQNKFDNPMPEVRKDFQNIRAELSKGMSAIQKENSACLSQLSDMTHLIKQVFSMVTNLSYKVRVEKELTSLSPYYLVYVYNVYLLCFLDTIASL